LREFTQTKFDFSPLFIVLFKQMNTMIRMSNICRYDRDFVVGGNKDNNYMNGSMSAANHCRYLR